MIISGFPLTNDNYLPSVVLLCSQFAWPNKLMTAHMQVLIDLLNPSNSLTSLQHFRDSIKNHTRSLTVLRKNSYGGLLVVVLLRNCVERSKPESSAVKNGHSAIFQMLFLWRLKYLRQPQLIPISILPLHSSLAPVLLVPLATHIP